jgi:hypothetical protein
MDYFTGLLDSGIRFTGIFGLVFSILYVLRFVYDTVKVYTLKEGKVELGEHGLIYLGCAIAYILTFILM